MYTTMKTIDSAVSKNIFLMFFENEDGLSPVQNEINKKFSNVILDNVMKNFDRKFLSSMVFPISSGEKIIALGLGKKEEFTLDKLRETASKVSSLVKSDTIDTAAIELVDVEFDKKRLFATTSIGVNMGNYKFDKYKTKKQDLIKTLEIIINYNDILIQDGENISNIVNSSMDFTKDLVFESAEVMTPSKVAEIAKDMAEELNLEIKVYDREELKKMNFNAFLAVGQGSIQEPKFIHIVYKGKNPKKKIALIGKGITFDSGGLDIKPASSMLTMKTDMTGCATVLGVIRAIAQLKPDIELHCMSALCENMPSGSSYKVGDVLISKSKKTIEVDNTDAEGRLTLADVLTYADEINPDEVIDIATLTGAVIVALGNNITGIMGNNQEQIEEFKKSANETGEKVWQLPIYEDMQENLKSDIADMKNTGSRYAGSSVAGRFLQNFTKSKKWLHIDIAGTAYIDKPYKEFQKGATAVMLRSLINYLLKN